mmetsp:Transcript_3529/g.6234  ORF Transcript_3529/g.6234 Transcript_3529/m.6234 type:complete len:230 (-) Transcript_3529:225-914(-)
MFRSKDQPSATASCPNVSQFLLSAPTSAASRNSMQYRLNSSVLRASGSLIELRDEGCAPRIDMISLPRSLDFLTLVGYKASSTNGILFALHAAPRFQPSLLRSQMFTWGPTSSVSSSPLSSKDSQSFTSISLFLCVVRRPDTTTRTVLLTALLVMGPDTCDRSTSDTWELAIQSASRLNDLSLTEVRQSLNEWHCGQVLKKGIRWVSTPWSVIPGLSDRSRAQASWRPV